MLFPENAAQARNSYYIISKALDIQNKGNTILEFCGTKTVFLLHPKTELPLQINCSYDMETNSQIIICKTTDWPIIKDTNNLKNSTLDIIMLKHFFLVKKENSYLALKKTLTIYSQTTIPDMWKNWLSKNAIPYYES